MLAIIFVGNLFASNVQAEMKNYSGRGAALFDFGDEDAQAGETIKNVAKLRAIKQAFEKAGFFVLSYAEETLNGKTTDEYISAIVRDMATIENEKIDKYFFNSEEYNRPGYIYEANLIAKIDTDKIAKYFQLDSGEKQKLIERDQVAKKNFEEIDSEFENLRRTADQKTQAQIKSELEKIDNKISATENKNIKIFIATGKAILYFDNGDKQAEETAKNVAKLRALKDVKQKVGNYIKDFSKNLNITLTDNNISNILNEISEIIDVKYEKLSSKNSKGKDVSAYESTVTIKIENEKLEKAISKISSEQKNIPMIFSQPVEIGEFYQDQRAGGFGINGATSNENLVENPQIKSFDRPVAGVSKFGNDDKALYIHFNSLLSRRGSEYIKFGGKNFKNTVQINLMDVTLFKIFGNNEITFYPIRKNWDIPFPYEHYVLLGRKTDGTCIKYFDTEDLCKKYFGTSDNISIKKLSTNGSTIVLYYSRCNKEKYFYDNKIDERGEFRFKWDDAVQWFGIEQIKY